MTKKSLFFYGFILLFICAIPLYFLWERSVPSKLAQEQKLPSVGGAFELTDHHGNKQFLGNNRGEELKKKA